MQVTKLARALTSRVEQYPPGMLAWEISANRYYLLITVHWAHGQYHNQAALSLQAIEADENLLPAFIERLIYELRAAQLRDEQQQIEELYARFRPYNPFFAGPGEGQY